MGSSKYFVWGSGAWRELDVSSGRVSGWRRRARFVFVRRGRLQLARRRPVLRALQALLQGEPSAAADGPRLSQRRNSVSKHRKQPAAPVAPAAPAVVAACTHHHCCAHFNGYNNNIDKALPSIPAAAPAPLPRQEAATQCSTDSSHAITIRSRVLPPDPPAPSIAPAHPTEPPSSSDEFVSTLVKRTNTTSVSALLGKHGPPMTSCTKPSQQPASKTNKLHSSSEEETKPLAAIKKARRPSTQASERSAEVCKELIISESDVAALRGFVARRCGGAVARFDADDSYKRALFYAINPLVELQRSASLEQLLRGRHHKLLPHFAARLGLTPTPTPAPAPAAPRRSRPCPARYRERSSSADTDKENKDKQTSANNVRSKRNLKRKAVARDAKPTSSEPVRATRRMAGTGADRPALTNGAVDSDSEAPPAKRAATRPRDPSAEIDSDHSDDKPVVKASDPATKPPTITTAASGTHVISKRASAAGAKVYSNLEDHAIVAWVSSGGRASQVNGNALWRSLEQQWPRLGGSQRSWHSLRNRYLRYILPALPALRLPPATVSRLRAAAATGAIKTKQRVAAGLARRNSLFKESAPRGAASRAARPRLRTEGEDAAAADAAVPTEPSPPGRRSLRLRATLDSSQESVTKETSIEEPRSPRYSDVTRRFAARHRPPASPSPSPPLAPQSPPRSPVLGTSRSRRLYNPRT